MLYSREKKTGRAKQRDINNDISVMQKRAYIFSLWITIKCVFSVRMTYLN